MDIEYIGMLAGEIGIRTAAQAFAAVSAFYPLQLIQPKTQFDLEEIFEDMLSERDGKDEVKP